MTRALPRLLNDVAVVHLGITCQHAYSVTSVAAGSSVTSVAAGQVRSKGVKASDCAHCAYSNIPHAQQHNKSSKMRASFGAK